MNGICGVCHFSTYFFQLSLSVTRTQFSVEKGTLIMNESNSYKIFSN